jgi:hypothetical protein
MPLKINKQLLLIKVETTFNTDATPTAALDAIQCEDPDFSVEPVVLERNFIKPTWDRTAHAMGRKLAKIKFVTEIKNGGTAGTQCRLGRLLTACGFKETLSAGVSAIYTPSSVATDHKSVTIYLYKDGIQHKITGAYGTVSFEGAVNGYGKATFEFIGQYYAPSDVALPLTPVFETTKPSQIELAQFTIDGFAATISKFSLDMGVEVLPRLDANGTDGYNGTYIGDRTPKGGIDPEATLVASQTFWVKMATAIEMAFNFRVGSAAGNIVTFTAPKCQYSGLTYAARDKIQTLDAGLMFNGSSGDDEVTITFT